MTKISGKVHAEQYGSLEECFQDFVLMFDNACKYNDPDSQVYKVCDLVPLYVSDWLVWWIDEI